MIRRKIMLIQRAQLNYLRMAPRKVRLVAQTIQGLSVAEAEALLLMSPRRAGGPLLKLLRSAAAGAKQAKSLGPERLVVSEIRVDAGPMLKRFLPRAMGRATPLQKKTSHVTIVLGEAKSIQPIRFRISKPEKAKKRDYDRARKEASEKKRQEGALPERKAEKPGFMKRLFRRKSV